MKKNFFKSKIILFTFLLLVFSVNIFSAGINSGDSKKEKKVTVYLLRHGKTIFNKNIRAQGWADTPLVPEGVVVAENVGKGLSDVKFVGAYSSDSGRSIETANIILAENKVRNKPILQQRKNMREYYFGKYEGEFDSVMWGAVAVKLGYSDMDELFKSTQDVRIYVDTLASIDETGEAETYVEWRDRVLTAFKQICEDVAKNGGGNILVVSHGMSSAMIINELDPSQKVFKLENASVNLIEYENGDYKIIKTNDMSYNEKGKALNK